MTRPTAVEATAPRVPEDETRRTVVGSDRRRGTLKVFFGYSAGVGRTRAMLAAASRRITNGSRVVLASHDSGADHGASRAARAAGLQFFTIDDAKGFDLDTVLRSSPDLLLLPGLAQRNPLSARHRRRYQDVEELLEAGIEVWSTLEVRQVESLADVVEKITEQRCLDTVPDGVLDRAAEVELIDRPPEELLDRWRRQAWPGSPQVVSSDQAVLVALREIALRFAADRLNDRFRTARDPGPFRDEGWTTSERLLVCVGPSPTCARVIRAASRMARSMHVSWFAVHVGKANSEVADPSVSQHLHLAETLGAEASVVPGDDVARELVGFARTRGVTRILIGKTVGAARFHFGVRRSVVDRVIDASGDLDVYVIRGAEGEPHGIATAKPRTRVRLHLYLYAGASLGVGNLVAWIFDAVGLGEAEVVLAYLLSVTAVAAWLGRGPAIFASCGAVALFNFFFTEPRHTLEVHDPGDLFTFVVMLVIGVLVSTLTSRIREQSVLARQRERRTEQLCDLTQDLSATTGNLQIVAAAEKRLSALLGCDVSILLADVHGKLRITGRSSTGFAPDDALQSVANWVFEHGRIAGRGTETHSEADAICLPLATPAGVVGVLAVRAVDADLLSLPDQRRLIEAFAAQVALALQRDRLAEQVHRSLAEAANERLRNAVLSSVSHDFRTPLAAITGASSSLLDAGQRIQPDQCNELLRTIHDEADRLARLVDNLLHMTRLESGQMQPLREWNVVEDLVGSALTRVARQLADREVTTDLAGDLPMLFVDGVLIEVMLTNLLDNAAKYSPAGSPIHVGATATGAWLRIEVADRGSGVSDEDKSRAFEKFYRGAASRTDGSRGTGLGLAICSAIAQLHRGHLSIEDRTGGGSTFVLELPIETQPPAIHVRETDGPLRSDGE